MKKSQLFISMQYLKISVIPPDESDPRSPCYWGELILQLTEQCALPLRKQKEQNELATQISKQFTPDL